MDLVPVADQRQHEQHDRDEKKSSRFGGIDGIVVMPLRGIVLGRLGGHGPIVALKSISFSLSSRGPLYPLWRCFDFPGTNLISAAYLRLTGGVGVLARRRIL